MSGFRDEIWTATGPEPWDGVDDWQPIEWCPTPDQVKALTIGTRLVIHGEVSFGYPEHNKRRGEVCAVEPHNAFFTGYAYRNEGTRHDGWRGDWLKESEPPSFTLERRIFVVLWKTDPGGREWLSLPSQVRVGVTRARSPENREEADGG